ncbi:hypothetical protein [Sulfolobus sp. E11-6]|uniref:hypothetical protein n=1 Tax=Sulfolobus sp. E11-6 TaxID=2663020 RepID=UPI001295C36F|nr:hypothetical protein [Sulfolobus sp. E11-6]QGA69441.1 hypothetical protein GFS33_12745 [Sulfolobus sp. E11-6]
MSTQALSNISSQLSHLVGNLNLEPISYILVLIGFALLLIIIIGSVIYSLAKAARAVPSMSTKEFILLLLGIAIFLVILGILLP